MRSNDSDASGYLPSGSARMGINWPFPAHSPFAMFFPFRLVSGFENAMGLAVGGA